MISLDDSIYYWDSKVSNGILMLEVVQKTNIIILALSLLYLLCYSIPLFRSLFCCQLIEKLFKHWLRLAEAGKFLGGVLGL